MWCGLLLRFDFFFPTLFALVLKGGSFFHWPFTSSLLDSSYFNGDLCVSILHPPIDDPQSGELPCERWNPTQNVRTILLSVISLLNEPNTFSPANVDASVMYRRWKESRGKDKEYENIVRKQVAASRSEAEKDNVVVPTTLDEYCIRQKPRPQESETDMTDFYVDDYGDDFDDEEEEEEYNEDDEDSGNEES
ncbi:ubiquitin-conjugating enzyme E2 R1-like isoform X3 [Tachypleus tridentatus]|uniref:ubiquitin-conjugating enzyme E2 R1-like isoform X3 n=1 Tax=Tachypleus tridentatus TaxID=6853 RepID=UPI003FCF59C8